MSRHSPIAVLLAAKAVSDVGFALDFVCFSVFVWVRTESGLATGVLGLCLYAGGVLGGQLGQRFGARWDRRRAMVTADLVRAGALALLAALPGATQLWWLFPTVFAVGAGRAVFEATLAAATPAMAGPERTQAVNSLISGLKGLALVAGMGVATLAVPWVGFRGVFLLDAASYALSAAVLLTVPLRLHEESARAAPTVAAPTVRPRSASSPMLGASPTRAGARPTGAGAMSWAALAGGGLVALVLVRGLDAFGSASHHIGLPLLGAVLDTANPARVVGALWMAWAAGLLVGSLGVRPLLAKVIADASVAVFGIATAVMSAGFIGIFWLGWWPAMLVVAGVAGVADALSEITFRQALQTLPDHSRGGAFGTAQIVLNVGFAAGVLSVGAVATPTRMAALVLLLHGVALVAATALAVRAVRRQPTTTHAIPTAGARLAVEPE